MTMVQKKLRFSRVVSLQGARQTGKSFLARELLPRRLAKAFYVSLDSKPEREMAEHSPETFLAKFEKNRPLLIDEAQKAPNLFDAVKLRVDEAPAPGQYILLGSTEFSREVLVRESLTGRLGRVRIFPMSYHELQGLEKQVKGPSRRGFLESVDRGGMPGIAFVRDAVERRALILDWLRLICDRDLDLFKKWRLDGELAMQIFRAISILEIPTLAEIARKTRVPARKVDTHLRALEQLFAIYKIPMHPSARGKKAIYLPLDPAVAAFFDASLQRKIQIFLLNERLCANHYAGHSEVRFYYYRSRTRNQIDLVEELRTKTRAFQIIESETFTGVTFEIMKAFLAKVPGSEGIIYAPVSQPLKIEGFWLRPWEEMVVLNLSTATHTR